MRLSSWPGRQELSNGRHAVIGRFIIRQIKVEA